MCDHNVQQSPEEETGTGSGLLEQENSDLLKRIGDLQQEKWTMEEKVGERAVGKWD